MVDVAVLNEIVLERTAARGDKKHYIPFTHEEFEVLRKQYNKPTWMPADFKLLLQAIGEGRVMLHAKPKAAAA